MVRVLMVDLSDILRLYETGESLSNEELEVLADASYFELFLARSSNVLRELGDNPDSDKLRTYCENEEAIQLIKKRKR